MTSEGVNPRVRGVLDPSKCHDPVRAVALHRAQEVPGKVFDALLSTGSLHVLFRVACADEERLQRLHLQQSGRAVRMTAEDLSSLVERGWLRQVGVWMEMTEAGREVTRALLAVARGVSYEAQAGKPMLQGREEGARV